jgi:tetratricopeptide (TPR) repeat protein
VFVLKVLAFGLSSLEQPLHKLAAQQFEKAATLEPKSTSLHLNAGHCYHHAGDRAKASAQYEKELLLDKSAQTLQLIFNEENTDANSKGVSADRGVRLAKILLRVPPIDPIGNLTDTDLNELKEAYDGSVRQPQKATSPAAVQTSEHALSLLGIARQFAKNPGAVSILQAATMFAESTGDDQLRTKFYIERGNSHIEARELPRAVAALRRAVTCDARAVAPYQNLGGVLRLMGRFDDALLALRAGLRRSGAAHELYQGLAFVEKDLGDSDAAITAMRHAIELHPTANYWTTLGTLLPDDDVDSQISAYSRAIEIDDNTVLAFCLRCERYAVTARWDECDVAKLERLQNASVSDRRMFSEPCLQPYHASYMPISALVQRQTAER